MTLETYHRLRLIGEMFFSGIPAPQISEATGMNKNAVNHAVDRLMRIRQKVALMPKPKPYTLELHYEVEFEVYDCDDYNAHFKGAETEEDRKPEDWGKEWPLPLID